MSDKYIIGIDPDSKKHGIALYASGYLVRLESMSLVDVMLMLISDFDSEEMKLIEVHIEDVCASSAVFRGGHSVSVQQSLARRLGMCQQSQVELERLLEFYEIKVVKHKISKKWKDAKSGKAEFERLTGWKGRSNEDTRSAAYFGFLGCK